MNETPMIQPGMAVQWWATRPRNGGYIKRSGIVLAYLPAGESIASYLGEHHPHVPPSAVLAGDVSRRARYLVRVQKPVRLPGGVDYSIYAPEAAKLERVRM
jgi:hypothetical protein